MKKTLCIFLMSFSIITLDHVKERTGNHLELDTKFGEGGSALHPALLHPLAQWQADHASYYFPSWYFCFRIKNPVRPLKSAIIWLLLCLHFYVLIYSPSCSFRLGFYAYSLSRCVAGLPLRMSIQPAHPLVDSSWNPI